MAEVERLCLLLSQVSGVDKAYRFLIYFLRLLSARYDPKHPFSLRVAALTGPLADTRMILRFFGLLPIIQSLRSASSFQDPLLRSIDRLQMLAMLVYYPMEHVYWLGQHQVLRSVKDAYWWSRWSCRAWAAWLGLDVVVVLYQLQPVREALQQLQREKKKWKAAQEGIKKSDDSDDSDDREQRLRSEREDLLLRLAGLVLDLPLAIHWSMASYPLSEGWVSLFGLLSTVSSCLLKWKYTNVPSNR